MSRSHIISMTLCAVAAFAIAFATGAPSASTTTAPSTRPFPRLQAIPEPYAQVSFERDGIEIARYHYGAALRRPFVFPIIGPSGRSLTRMGHPHDPESHSHHNSFWVSHNDVGGVNFWDDRGKGRIVHQRIVGFDDDRDLSAVTTVNQWTDDATKKVLLIEHRRTAIQLLDGGESLLLLDLKFEPAGNESVTLGKTPFGLVGVRMAKTMGTIDGGGTIRNSEGAVNEKDVLWKRANWCDYSGPITKDVTEGLTLLDHPSNPNYPTFFHVRADGWMGASLTFDAPRTIEPGKPLRLRYGLYVHAGQQTLEHLQRRWEAFAKTTPDPLEDRRH